MKKGHCSQCGKPLNAVAVLLNAVCGDCVRKNHNEYLKRPMKSMGEFSSAGSNPGDPHG